MFKIFGFVLQLVALVFLASAAANASQKLQVDLDIFETTIYGHSWDGFAIGLGRGGAYGALPTTSPPDAALCVVYASQAECYHRGTDKKPISLCHDSYNCSWTVDIPVNGSFGLLFYEIDTMGGKGASDFIDAVILSRDDGTEEQIDGELRALLASISVIAVKTPKLLTSIYPSKSITIRTGEAERRVRPFKEISVSDCRTSCRLQQSQIRISQDR